MASVKEILDKVNQAIKEPIDSTEYQEALVALHTKLTEPKWAIEDEKLRNEMEKLVVQMAVSKYKEQSK